MCGRGLVAYANVAVSGKMHIASGSGSTSIGARWRTDAGGAPTTGYNAEMLNTGEAGLWLYQSTAISQHRFDNFVITVLSGESGPGGRLYAPASENLVS